MSQLLRRVAFVSALTASIFVVLEFGGARSLNAEVVGNILPQDFFGTTQVKVVNDLRKATDLYVNGDTDGCLETLRQAKQSHASLPTAEVMQAVIQVSIGDAEKARESLDMVAASQLSSATFLATLARVNLAEGHPVEALLLLEQAVGACELNDDWSLEQKKRFIAACSREKIDALQSLKHWSELAALLTEIPAKEADNEQRNLLAYSLFQIGQDADAKSVLQKSGGPNLLLFAKWCAAEGDYDRAVKVLDEMDSPTDQSRLVLASYLLDQGNLGRVAANIKAITALGSQPTVDLLNARLALQEGRHQAACDLLDRCYRSSPKDLVVANTLARTLLLSEDSSEIQRGVDIAFAKAAMHPDEPSVLETLGFAHLRLGKPEDAEAELIAIAAKHSLSADGAYFLALSLAENGKLELGQQLLQRAVTKGVPFDLRPLAKKWLTKNRRSVAQRFDNQNSLSGSRIEKSTDAKIDLPIDLEDETIRQ